MDAFAGLAPIHEAYATLPVAEAFDWRAAEGALPTGEWYLVAFRSIRRVGADEALLCRHDDLAHEEAARSPGFVHYYRGPTASDRSCLSFCLWDSRSAARASAGGPAHLAAISLIALMYERYTLEFLRVRRRAAGAPLEFEPYDPVPPRDVTAGRPH